eukprot:CAMPEP_0206498002 /NCGR_PEP_ID=MMETSP0324_2-20121206/50642_1 /ASSEMBLY_ACC=CAM_ASM_000836 /TAXON_ID=2866 /ORGANISM="Crypthecodinium cohnii, Strain Seligo" /LENGTH=221 /DNA_ID=CAMNT_0053983921 /DNA_START=17 /DNA_END=678 /DNA_ORIENTATION=-
MTESCDGGCSPGKSSVDAEQVESLAEPVVIASVRSYRFLHERFGGYTPNSAVRSEDGFDNESFFVNSLEYSESERSNCSSNCTYSNREYPDVSPIVVMSAYTDYRLLSPGDSPYAGGEAGNSPVLVGETAGDSCVHVQAVDSDSTCDKDALTANEDEETKSNMTSMPSTSTIGSSRPCSEMGYVGFPTPDTLEVGTPETVPAAVKVCQGGRPCERADGASG